MTPRSHRSSQERDDRPRAVQILATEPLICGSLVLQHRSCGKSYCRCQKGQKRPAPYLHARSGDRRVRIYIPPALHETARRWVDNGRRLRRLVQRISEHQLQALLEQEQQILARRRGAEGPAP